LTKIPLLIFFEKKKNKKKIEKKHPRSKKHEKKLFKKVQNPQKPEKFLDMVNLHHAGFTNEKEKSEVSAPKTCRSITSTKCEFCSKK
jgi:hypothetical protein